MAPEDTERLATWIDKDLMEALRVFAALTGQSHRQVIEYALRDYMTENPVDVNEALTKIERALEDVDLDDEA